MRVLGLLLILILSACDPLQVQMPDEVRPYYNDFFNIVGFDKQVLGQIDIVPKITIGNPNGDVAGQCATMGMYYVIQINQATWNAYSDETRRTLIFHELTHCVFMIYEHSQFVNNYMFREILDIDENDLHAQVIDNLNQFEQRIKNSKIGDEGEIHGQAN